MANTQRTTPVVPPADQLTQLADQLMTLAMELRLVINEIDTERTDDSE